MTELKPIAPVQEFVLRAIATGLRRHDEIAGLLDLDEDVARAAVVQLKRDDDVALVISAKPASVDVRARPLARAKSALPSVQKARRRLAA